MNGKEDNSVLMRIGKRFDKEVKEIIRARYNDIDKDLDKPISSRRITDLLTKLPEWANIKARAIKIPKKEDLI